MNKLLPALILGSIFLAAPAVAQVATPPFSAIVSNGLARAANSTTYTANTGWNNATSAATGYFTFSSACRTNSGAVLIPEIDVYSNQNPVPTLKLTGILWLFNTVPATLINDNAAFTISPTDFPNLTGPMQGFPFTLANAQSGTGTFSSATLSGTTYHAQCATGTTSIYGMVQVTNAYVPLTGEVLTVRLHTVGAN